MLTYHPAYDVNHCVYRFLLILENVPLKKIELNILKIIDFYILFPSLLKDMSLPAKYKGVKKYFKTISSSYENISNPPRLMFELGNIQFAGLSALIAKNLISKEDYIEELVSRTKMPLPKEISDLIKRDPIIQEAWFIFLVTEFHKIDFNGNLGIKARTGLMEFKYDL